MSMNFIQSDRKTSSSFPPSIEKWLHEGNLAQFVVETVEQLNLRSLRESCSGQGSHPYTPAMLTALLFYGYATGVFSSRKLERSTYDSAAFRYISANMHPDHDSIANFRRRFSKELSELFVQILMIASLMGVFIPRKAGPDDGSKANGSRYKDGYSCNLEAQLKVEVADWLRKAEAADSADMYTP